jgi:hypothetical protein
MQNKMAKELKFGQRFRMGPSHFVCINAPVRVTYPPTWTERHVAAVDEKHMLIFIHPDNSVELDDKITEAATAILGAATEVDEIFDDENDYPSDYWPLVGERLSQMANTPTPIDELDGLTIMCLRGGKLPLAEPRVMITAYQGNIQNITVINGLTVDEIEQKAMDEMVKEVERLVGEELGQDLPEIGTVRDEFVHNEQTDEYHWGGEDTEGWEVKLVDADENEFAINNLKYPTARS